MSNLALSAIEEQPKIKNPGRFLQGRDNHAKFCHDPEG
jgi:hypothetical protein